MENYVRKRCLLSLTRFCLQELKFKQQISLRADIFLGVDRQSTYQFHFKEEIDQSCFKLLSCCTKNTQTDEEDFIATRPEVGAPDIHGGATNQALDSTGSHGDGDWPDIEQAAGLSPFPPFPNSLADPLPDIHASDIINNQMTVVPTDPNHNGRTATGEFGQVSCPLCATAFPDHCGVEDHLKRVHDIGNLHTCLVCQEICPSYDALFLHMQEKHEDIEPTHAAHPNANAVETILAGRKKMRKSVPKKVMKNKPIPFKTLSARTTRSMTKSAQNVMKRGPRIAKKHHGGKDPSGNNAVEKNQNCEECGKEYKSKRALRRHVMNVHQFLRYSCDLCSKSFTGKESLYHHKRGMHSDDKPYKCEQCGASFNFNHSYKLHLLKHSGQRPYTCGECGKTYLTANHLKIHTEAVHGNKKNYSCHFCGRLFSYTTSLKMHVMSHTGERPYQCGQCTQRFINSHSLKYHMESHHSTGERFECDVCGKSYKTAFLMKSHRRRHTAAGTRFMCDVCGRQFMFRSTLDAHSVVHHEEKNFHCSICNKSFKTHATLYSHMYVHKTDSPFQCAECGKAFKTKERCKAHVRRHTGIKPFECELCSRCFPDKGGLTKHQKTVHCTVKKYVCNVCGKACSRADNLRVHMKIHRKPDTPPEQQETEMLKPVNIPPGAGEFSTVFPERAIKPARNLQNNAHVANTQPNVTMAEVPLRNVMLTEMVQIQPSCTTTTATVTNDVAALSVSETIRHHNLPSSRPMISISDLDVYSSDHLPDTIHTLPPNQMGVNPINLTQSGNVLLTQPQIDRALNAPTGGAPQMYMWPYMYPHNANTGQDSNAFF
ncbi:hypothetical protein ScPMuIL_001345 [Solemya velum]